MEASLKNYAQLMKQGQKIHTLESIAYLLDWDQETYMPHDAASFRGDQLKSLAGIIHKEKVGRKFTALLSKMMDIKTGALLAHDLNERQKSALREWRRDYLIESALPKKFVEDFAKLCSQSILVWREARKNNNFKEFAPYLKKLITASRKKADYIGTSNHPYEALLDLYEPGMTVSALDRLFSDLKSTLLTLLKEIEACPQVDDKILHGSFPEEKQMQFFHKLMEAIGYDFKKGRLDLSTHPFCSSFHPNDSRITTRLNRNNIFDAISTVLHESGHGFYGMGLPIEEFGSPLGQALSMGMHESQSRFWETRIGLSLPFLRFVLPLIQQAFPGQLTSLSPEACYRAINKVTPSLIRVEADEVTYPLHVILRYEIEKMWMEGTLKAEDLPEVWNEKMKTYLGITPPTDKEGCLQDIHWAMGGIGYFPTYTLGNLFAASWFSLFQKEHPHWETNVAQGDFGFIKAFLSRHIYAYGRQYTSPELIERALGKPFSAHDYATYLQSKYHNIYSPNIKPSTFSLNGAPPIS